MHSALTICLLAPWSAGVLYYVLSLLGLARHGRWRVAKLRKRTAQSEPSPAQPERPPVSVIIPVKGLTYGLEEALSAFLQLSYPDYELLVSVADTDDPALTILKRCQGNHPNGHRLKLFIGDQKKTANPKLNNLFKPMAAAQHALIVMTDITARPDQSWLDTLVQHLTPDVGLVSALSPATEPDGLWAAWDAAIVNGYTMRLLASGDRLGTIAPMGKTLLLRTEDLQAIGSIEAMDAGFCEDSALAQAIRKIGKQTILIDAGITNPLGRKTFSEVWQRHIRWFNCRRHHAYPVFLLEFWLSFLPLAIGGAFALWFLFDWSPAWVFMAHIPLFAIGEIVLATAQHRKTDRWLLAGCILRELLHPVIWVAAFCTRQIDWRGTAMVTRPRS